MHSFYLRSIFVDVFLFDFSKNALYVRLFPYFFIFVSVMRFPSLGRFTDEYNIRSELCSILKEKMFFWIRNVCNILMNLKSLHDAFAIATLFAFFCGYKKLIFISFFCALCISFFFVLLCFLLFKNIVYQILFSFLKERFVGCGFSD